MKVKVRNLSKPTYHRFHLHGRIGVVENFSNDQCGIRFENAKNEPSSKGLFWFKADDLEILDDGAKDDIENLKGFTKIAVVNMCKESGSRDYAFALYDDEIQSGDSVLVTGQAKNKILTVKEVVPADPKNVPADISAEVICKVNLSDYLERVKKRKMAETLREQMREKRKEIESRKNDDYYASADPGYAEMLKKLRELQI